MQPRNPGQGWEKWVYRPANHTVPASYRAANNNVWALARALAGDPKVLLADEPTGSLDFRTGDMIADLIDQVHQVNGLTSVFVTHSHSFALRCDRVLELEKGLLQTPSGMELPGSRSCARRNPSRRWYLCLNDIPRKARRVIFFARYEASQFGSPYIETEHLFAGSVAGRQSACQPIFAFRMRPSSLSVRQIEAHTTVREKVFDFGRPAPEPRV